MTMDRRGFLQTVSLSTAGLMLSGRASSAETAVTSPLKLAYGKPAETWVEALPLGNGRLGAMVFGRVKQERLQLNEDTLWAGSPYNPVNPKAAGALQTVRDLINKGEYKKASDLSWNTLLARPVKQMPYGSAGDIFLDFIDAEAASQYSRALELDTAISRTRYKTPKGTFTRESFVSPLAQVVVVRLTATGKAARLNLDLGYRHPGEAHYGAPIYNGKVEATQSLGATWDKQESLKKDQRPQTLSIKPDGDTSLLITGRNIAYEGIPSGLTYALKVTIISDGKVMADGDTLSLRGGQTATILISAATSYVDFQTTSGDPVAKVRRDIAAAVKIPYAQLKGEHVKSHKALFDRFHIELGGALTPALTKETTDQRISRSPDRDDPKLAALYLQYARYLLICSSREGSQPANLQGIWNEGIDPPWGCKYTININTEMNYWPAAPANLGECIEPLLKMVEDLTVTGAVTAKSMYNARGWVAHHNTDLWRATAPIDGPLWGQWPMGGAWLCTTLWDYYDYFPSKPLLKRLYPLLRGSSLFFMDFLIEDPQGRGLVTSPSLSPENAHIKDTALCAGPAMDRQILRDLFDQTLSAYAQSGSPIDDKPLMDQIAAARKRLAPDKIGKHGQLQEWLDDWDDRALDQQHRHVSHLYGIYPSQQLNVRDTPDFIEAAKVTLKTRGDLATGWGTAWRLCLWARMGDGEHAYTVLKGLLGPERTYPNMFDAHPPFQIDGNFGGGAGIMEMIAQSWGGEIHLLPALPKAWAEGKVTGLRARGGVEIDLGWSAGALDYARLKGPPNTSHKLSLGGKSHSITLDTQGFGALSKIAIKT